MSTYVLHNAKIYVEKGVYAEACAIEGNKFAEVGTNADILAHYPDAELIDCEGRTVLPGINDSHCHIFMVAQNMLYVQIMGSKSVDEVIQRGKDFLAAHPDSRGLRGMGWNVVDFVEGEQRDLTRYDLDKISTDIPISFNRACGHMVVFNSKAIELAGIDKDTPQVEGGLIGKFEDGTPNGQFSDNAGRLLKGIVPEPTLEEVVKEFKNTMKYAASVGITSVQSNDPGTVYSGDVMYKVLHDYHDAGDLIVRYHSQNSFDNIDQFKVYLEGERNDPRYDDIFSAGPLKLFKDGSIGGRSALLREEYCDDPGNFGLSVHSDEELDAYCKVADENGLQVVCHCIGDGAVQSLIERYEKIMHDGHNPHRNAIIHCQLTDMPMIERIVKDEIIPMEQPIFLDSDMHALETRISPELARTSNAYGSYLRLGQIQSFGTDSPVEDINPFPCIYSAVTRCDKHGFPEGGYFPEEKISVEDAVDCYTCGSAYAQFMEDRKGRIKPGFLADLTVLDKDIFTIDPMDIRNIKPVMTMMDGKITFCK